MNISTLLLALNHVKVDNKGDIYWAEPGEDVMNVVTKTDKEITEFKKKYLKNKRQFMAVFNSK